MLWLYNLARTTLAAAAAVIEEEWELRWNKFETVNNVQWNKTMSWIEMKWNETDHFRFIHLPTKDCVLGRARAHTYIQFPAHWIRENVIHTNIIRHSRAQAVAATKIQMNWESLMELCMESTRGAGARTHFSIPSIHPKLLRTILSIPCLRIFVL